MIVCRCNNVDDKDVHDMQKEYPNFDKKFIKHILKIGKNCGCCNSRDCPVIEKFFDDL